jgi:hypothetical protein
MAEHIYLKDHERTVLEQLIKSGVKGSRKRSVFGSVSASHKTAASFSDDQALYLSSPYFIRQTRALYCTMMWWYRQSRSLRHLSV